MSDKRPIEVHYTVLVDDKEMKRLEQEGREAGNGYSDAGPVLTVQRYLMSEGLDNCFPKEHSLGLEFTLHTKGQK